MSDTTASRAFNWFTPMRFALLLALLTEYLYHPDETVRHYTSQGLAYWPDDAVTRRLTELLHTRGPSDVVVERTFRTPGAVGFILPYLQSDNPLLSRGVI